MKLIAALFASLVMLASCSEDPVSVDTKPYLEVSPDSVDVQQYDFFTLKFRIRNFSNEDGILVSTNYGNGDSTAKLNIVLSEIMYSYIKAGNYILTLSAYDSFADTLIATKAVPITVNPVQSLVVISPANLDTTFTNTPLQEHKVRFQAFTNVQAPNLHYEWSMTGDGKFNTSSAGDNFSAFIETEGAYKVFVKLSDNITHTELATDSTNVTVHFQ